MSESNPGPGLIGRAVRWLFWFFVRLGLRVAAFVALVIGIATFYYYVSLPRVDALYDDRNRGSVTLLDQRGDPFAWRGAQFGGEITPSDVSPYLTKAILTAEDRRFYSHFGVDPRGLARAMVANARAGRFVQGGSTLTQQVAKNVFLTSERTIERKLKEIPVAIALELRYSKDEILAIYMNRVYLGAGATGFEAAAQRYFGKSARAVNLAESAMLAGLLKAPSRFAPTSDMDRAQGRASVILNAMKETGAASEAEVARALANPATLSPEAARKTGAHYADWVMEDGPEYLTAAADQDVVIRTYFSPRLQRAAEDGLNHVFNSKVKRGSTAEAAVVIMDHEGRVRAMVGGRDARASIFNRATRAMRQTGSAFKPVVYAAAMEAGYSMHDTIVDEPLTMKVYGKTWSPKNYSGRYEGPVTLTEALANSINTVAVRLSERVGRDAVRDLAADLGITTPLADGPALALGVSEATLLEMTGVYAAFANGGRAVSPTGIAEITLRGEREPLIRADDEPRGRRAISPDSAAKLTRMMREVVRGGTGTRARLPDREVAGKTGTTQGARDAWFIGYTGDLVIGVWMGKDDNEPLAGVTGGGLSADIWREVAARAHRGLPETPLKTRITGDDARVARSGGGGGGSRSRGGGDGVVETIFNDVFTFLRGEASKPRAPATGPDPTVKVDR